MIYIMLRLMLIVGGHDQEPPRRNSKWVFALQGCSVACFHKLECDREWQSRMDRPRFDAGKPPATSKLETDGVCTRHGQGKSQ